MNVAAVTNLAQRSNSIVRQPLITRNASSNWREIAAISGVAIAIYSFVTALFFGLAWGYTAAFGILIVSALFSWKMAKQLGIQDHLSHPPPQNTEQELLVALNQTQQEQAALSHEIEAIKRENRELKRKILSLSPTKKQSQSICRDFVPQPLRASSSNSTANPSHELGNFLHRQTRSPQQIEQNLRFGLQSTHSSLAELSHRIEDLRKLYGELESRQNSPDA